MAQWIGAQGWANSAKNAKACPHCDVTTRKLQTQNETFFFQFELEDLLNPQRV